MSEREDVLSGEGEEGDYHGDGDSWTDDADEVDFGSLNPFVKSTNLAGMSGETNYNHLRRHSDDMGLIRTHSFDPNLFDIRQVSPDKLAEQMTLVDLAQLKVIKRAEFHRCCWTKKSKLLQAPNICTFLQHFNHTSFLVQREILNQVNVKIRAEVVALFVRVAKKLQDLNNLHSLVAVVLSLDSPPIRRLSQTWKQVHRKEKSILERLTEFVSEEENSKQLREHMSSLKLPCIPHLGMYLRDLVYLDSHASLASTDQQREAIAKETDVVLNVIAQYQLSQYDQLSPDIPIQTYLKSVRFIEELQRFHEDENYKLSHQREPDDCQKREASLNLHLLRTSRSTEDLATPLKPELAGPTELTSHAHQRTNGRRRLERTSFSSASFDSRMPAVLVTGSPDLRGKKSSTLPVGLQASAASKSNGVLAGEMARRAPISPAVKRGHKKSRSLGSNVLAKLGVNRTSSPYTSRKGSPDPPISVSLLDDSFLDDTIVSTATDPITGSTEYFTPPLSAASSSSGANADDREDEDDEFLRDVSDDLISLSKLDIGDVIKDGLLKCRVLKKQGNRVSFRMKTKYYVQLTQRSLLLMPSKYKNPKKSRAGGREVKLKKVKYTKLLGCHVRHKELSTQLKDKQFIVVDETGNHTKFSAESDSDAHQWVTAIREAIEKEQENEKRQQQEVPLIQL